MSDADQIASLSARLKAAEHEIHRQRLARTSPILTEPGNLNKVLTKKYKDVSFLHGKATEVESFLDEVAPKTAAGEIDRDRCTPNFERATVALAELIRFTEVTYSAIAAAAKLDQHEQLAVFESYFDWMQPNIVAPHQDFVDGKKRLTDIQQKEYRAAVQDMRERTKEKEKEREFAKKSGGQQQQGGGNKRSYGKSGNFGGSGAQQQQQQYQQQYQQYPPAQKQKR
jgi:hypothetical protein